MTIIYYYKDNSKRQEKVVLDVLKNEDFIAAKKNNFKKYREAQPSKHYNRFENDNLVYAACEHSELIHDEWVTEKYAVYASNNRQDYEIISEKIEYDNLNYVQTDCLKSLGKIIEKYA